MRILLKNPPDTLRLGALGMKKMIRQTLEALLVILLFPQLFVFLYYFSPVIHGPGSLGLIKHLLVLGLTMAQLFCPVLFLLYWGMSTLNQQERRAGASFLICFITGYLCLIGWNKIIFETFSTTWGSLPLFICSAGVGLYHYFKDPGHIAPRKPELFLATD
jgi:Na+/proline symporter